MKNIVLGSKNPVKAQATLSAFRRMFPEQKFNIQLITVPSDVSDQPMTSYETLQGASNRASHASHQIENADFWVGIEGGVEVLDGQLSAFAWVVVKSPTKTGKSRTGTFFLPDKVARLIREGKELGEADDIVFSQTNSKQKNGAVGILTNNVIDRMCLYEHAAILALLPFKQPELYPNED
ncbi:MAG: inosine/xanthosine triphosphatase [Anaerolineaceae bacterium]|nr:inosine/xanthosine triphosphatase [Anaerolineaceae bacterium]